MITLQVTADAWDGLTAVDLTAAVYDAATQRHDLTVVGNAGNLQLAQLAPLGGPRGVWVQMIQPSGFVPTLQLVLPNGQFITLPDQENIWIPQGCSLAIDGAGAPGSVELWLWPIHSVNYPDLTCCHSFAPSTGGCDPSFSGWYTTETDGGLPQLAPSTPSNRMFETFVAGAINDLVLNFEIADMDDPATTDAEVTIHPVALAGVPAGTPPGIDAVTFTPGSPYGVLSVDLDPTVATAGEYSLLIRNRSGCSVSFPIQVTAV